MRTERPPSPRRQVADTIANFIIENDLAQVFGGDVSLERNRGRSGKHYVVVLSRRETLTGVVRVFAPTRIQVYTRGPLGFGSGFFKSAAAAVLFLKTAYVDNDRNAAHKMI